MTVLPDVIRVLLLSTEVRLMHVNRSRRLCESNETTIDTLAISKESAVQKILVPVDGSDSSLHA